MILSGKYQKSVRDRKAKDKVKFFKKYFTHLLLVFSSNFNAKYLVHHLHR